MFSDNLLYLRNLKGLSQEQVAEAVGISRQSYSKWEQGDTFPDIDKCDKLAKFYGVTIDSLIHSDEKIGKTKIAPAPIGKHLWGTVTIGSKGQIVIPKNARDTFDMKEGDRLLQHSISTQDAKATHRLVRRCVESYLPVKSATILTPNAGASSITNRFSRAFIFTHFRINGK